MPYELYMKKFKKWLIENKENKPTIAYGGLFDPHEAIILQVLFDSNL
jgi:hypothetical protein